MKPTMFNSDPYGASLGLAKRWRSAAFPNLGHARRDHMRGPLTNRQRVPRATAFMLPTAAPAPRSAAD
jgi:hypothetical protein